MPDEVPSLTIQELKSADRLYNDFKTVDGELDSLYCRMYQRTVVSAMDDDQVEEIKDSLHERYPHLTSSAVKSIAAQRLAEYELMRSKQKTEEWAEAVVLYKRQIEIRDKLAQQYYYRWDRVMIVDRVVRNEEGGESKQHPANRCLKAVAELVYALSSAASAEQL